MLTYGEVSFIYISYQYTGASVYFKISMKYNFLKGFKVLKQIFITNRLVKDWEIFSYQFRFPWRQKNIRMNE